jgi:hypothetical protein
MLDGVDDPPKTGAYQPVFAESNLILNRFHELNQKWDFNLICD